MAVLSVGSGKPYSTIAAAVAAAQNGDTIEVQAGTYVNDYVSISKNVTLQGVGGMASVVSTSLIPNGKAIFITSGNVTFNNFEFSGAKVSDANGAGIRYEGGNLTLNNCYFHDNQDGLLGGSFPTGTLTINNSEFAFNGTGDGQTHNLYIGAIANLTINNSYFHDASEGHEIKSRALNTTITNSRIYDLSSTASYSIDLPNGGNAVIQNNIIQQGSSSHNPVIITAGEEGNSNPTTNFLISGNTILNDLASSSFLAVRNSTAATAQIINNQFFGVTAGQIASGPNTQSGNQFLTTEPVLDESPPMTSSTPALSITADQTSKLEGNSGTTPFTFTVTRSGSTAGTSSVSYAVSGGTANAADFGGTLPSGTVSFAAGETSKSITVNVSGDTTVEPDESFNVVLSSPVGATIGTGTASSTILNDDVAAPALSITADQTSKLEGNSGTTPFTFTVTRSGSTIGTSSVSYAVSGGTANAADFGGTLPSGTVSFAAGETSKSITVNVSGDTTVEPDESFNVVLSSPAGATIGTGTASSTILNDDVAAPALSITAAQMSKLEGNSGATPFTFTVTRSGSTAGTSSASYAVSGGTANAADFGGTLPSGTVSFAAGETSKTITVQVSGDTTVEPDESFNVVLSSPAGATIGTGTASSTILNDDVAAPALSLTADQTSKLEGDSGTTPFTFTVTRSGSTAGTSSVNYAVSGGTANAADFGGTLPSGTVSFAAGETSKLITVNVSGDPTVEPDETFNVVLSSPSGATIGTGTASSTILNDDVAATALSITADQTSKLEGNSGTTPFTFTVTRSGSTAGTSLASYAVSGGTANAADFGGTLPSGTVSFAAGETSRTVTLKVSGDTTVEPDESFNVVLSSPAGATIGTGTASSTILNDDVAAPALSITAAQMSKLEGNSGATPFTFTVTRSGSTAGTSLASYAVSGGTAN